MVPSKAQVSENQPALGLPPPKSTTESVVGSNAIEAQARGSGLAGGESSVQVVPSKAQVSERGLTDSSYPPNKTSCPMAGS